MGLLQEIYSGRWAEGIRRTFLMRGQLRLQVPGDIQPVIDLTELAPHEQRNFKWRLFTVGILDAAVAAQLGRVQLAVPAGAGVIAEITGLFVGSSAGMSISITHDGTPVGAPNAVTDDDSREANFTVGSPTALTISGDTAGASVGTAVAVLQISANGIYVPMQTVLSPGHNINVIGGAVNVGLVVTWWGRWRRLEPGEE